MYLRSFELDRKLYRKFFHIVFQTWPQNSYLESYRFRYPFASGHKGPGFKSPGGYLCETRILLLALSCYIGDPDMIDHICGLVWGGLRPKPS
jgi:hypothetical protein